MKLNTSRNDYFHSILTEIRSFVKKQRDASKIGKEWYIDKYNVPMKDNPPIPINLKQQFPLKPQ